MAAQKLEQQWDFSDLRAVIFNCTLKKSPEQSNTEGLIEVSTGIMKKCNELRKKCGVKVAVLIEDSGNFYSYRSESNFPVAWANIVRPKQHVPNSSVNISRGE